MARKLKDAWVTEAAELRIENARLTEENVLLTAEKDKLATEATTANVKLQDAVDTARLMRMIALVQFVGAVLYIIGKAVWK